MSNRSVETFAELALANRILSHEGVMDVFGHVSVRDPGDSQTYLISRSRSPETVEPGDILRHHLDSRPLDENAPRSYSERVIHGTIYRRRSDVNAVCHFHAPAIMPFCVTGAELVPVSHIGATIGGSVPYWGSREAFGDTDLLVTTNEQAESLADALGAGWAVLMRNHGGVVAGRSLREAIFRAIALCENAILLQRAAALGPVQRLTPTEVKLAGDYNLQDRVLARAWEYWRARLDGADGNRFRTAALDAANPLSVTDKATATP